MTGNRILLRFLLKFVVLSGILLLPLNGLDELYGKFYRKVCSKYLGQYREKGVAHFKKAKKPELTLVKMGNLRQRSNSGYMKLATSEFNTRYRGYLPTVLLISLILASPVSINRRIIGALTGLLLITIIILWKQWVHLNYITTQAKWLDLTNYSSDEEKRVLFLFNNFANYNGPTFIAAIAIWLLVTFRKSDFMNLIPNNKIS